MYSLIVALCSLAVASAIRIAQDVDMLRVQTCSDALKETIKKSTYQYFVAPLIQGKYYIKSAASGKYLYANSSGHLETVDPGSNSWRNRDKVWYVSRQDGESHFGWMPSFTVKHRKTAILLDNNVLVCDGRDPCQPRILFERASDGVHWKIKVGHLMDGHGVRTFFYQEDASGKIRVGSDPTLWYMEYVPTLSDRGVFPLPMGGLTRLYKAKVELAKQMPAAKAYPLWEGSNRTWGDFCRTSQAGPKGEIGPHDTCLEFVNAERTFFNSILRLNETRSGIVNYLKLNGICDAPLASFATIFHKTLIAEALKSYGGDACSDLDLESVSLAAQDAAVAECYQDCMDAMDDRPQDMLCFRMQEVNQSLFYEEIIDANDQCASLPSSHLEGLLEFKLKQKCWTFSPPTPIWLTNDHSLGDVNEVCEAENSWLRRTPSLKEGERCPAGTACNCPGPTVYPKLTGEIRRDHNSVFVTDGGAGNVAVATGLFSMLRMRFTMYYLMGVATFIIGNPDERQTLVNALTGSAFNALIRLKDSTIVKVQVGMAVLRASYTQATWRCTKTVACWPAAPRRVRKTVGGSRSACRAKESIRELNGGATWMMPPPGLKYKRKMLRCVLDSCSLEERAFQKIGFGNAGGFNSKNGQQEVYNCQPLAWEEMSVSQRVKYLEILYNTGVDKEYDLASALDESRRALLSPAPLYYAR